jgi:hypothetical protein
MNIIEIIGWVASILLLGSYFLNIKGKIKSTSAIYLICNLVAGVLFTIFTFVRHTYPNMVVNIVWVLIAAEGLLRKNK